MPIHASVGNWESRRVMVFVDGGYLTRKLRDMTGDEVFKIRSFSRRLTNHFLSGIYRGEIIRIYYYDCQYDINDPNLSKGKKEKYKENLVFYNSLKSIRDVEVRLGQLIASSKRDKQKGADILLAIDMLTKAYQNQYDAAILLACDRDFIPLIQSIKNMTGKKVYGVVFEGSPNEYNYSFDDYFTVNKENVGILRLDKYTV